MAWPPTPDYRCLGCQPQTQQQLLTFPFGQTFREQMADIDRKQNKKRVVS